LVNRSWDQSSGTTNYLGEWHTHPEVDPSPSGTDLKNWSRILKGVDTDLDSLFFLIVGSENIRAWEGTREGLGIVELLFFGNVASGRP
jgi:integrative and conjugative element protein (TIGR02256 family)